MGMKNCRFKITNMKKSKYVVTAINALTGDREAISLPRPHRVAKRMLDAALACHESSNEFAPYSGYRLTLYKGERKPRIIPPPIKTGLKKCRDCISVRPVYFSVPD